MADSPLDAGGIEAALARVRGGGRVAVSEHLTLFPDTRAERSELRARPDGTLEHVTFFHEFAPGHGWSTEQQEVRALDESAARELLRRAGRAEP
jgi:hypothetical protein